MHHLKRYFLVYTLVPLVIISFSASYYRFMVTYDYEVIHEGFCDPYQEQCFLSCEDDECTEPFYYNTITRRADALHNMCGDSLVSECESAQSCQLNELDCLATYCTPDSDMTCEELSVQDQMNETISELENLDEINNNFTDS